MAHADAKATSDQLLNYAGMLMNIGPSETPFLAMSGNITGGRRVQAATFVMSNTISMDSASENSLVTETASLSAPASDIYAPTQKLNYTGIYHRAVEFSYRQKSNSQSISGEALIGTATTQGTLQQQRDAQMLQMAQDMDYCMLLGTGTDPTGPSVTGATKGLITAIAAAGTTEEDAASAWLSTKMIENMAAKVLANGGKPKTPALVGGAAVIAQLNNLYGFQPQSISLGGLDLEAVIIPLVGRCAVVYDPQITTTSLLLADMARVKPVMQPVDGVPVVFEQIAKTGAGEKWQLYCQFGVDYGHENYHGYIKSIKIA